MKKYKVAGPLNSLKSGSVIVAVDISSVNAQVAGFDSEEDLVDLVHRIHNDNIFAESFDNRLKGTLGDSLAAIVEEIEKICEKNKINLHKYLEMRNRRRKFTST